MNGPRSIVLRAHAKLNLALQVGGKRDDGYHEVATVIAAVSVYDTVRVELAASRQVSIQTEGWPVPRGPKNLCYRAAVAYMRAAADEGWAAYSGRPGGVRVSLVKRIPPGGGLGGGSSDAAAVLLGLNLLCSSLLDEARLNEVAAGLGSDVPFFLSGTAAALATGRGERIEPVPVPEDASFVIAWPGAAVATGWAYGLLGADDFSEMRIAQAMARAMRDGAGIGGLRGVGVNAFLGPVTRQRADIAELMSAIEGLGASVTSIAGSGACVWGLFDTAQAARRAARSLQDRGVWAQVAGVAPAPVEAAWPVGSC